MTMAYFDIFIPFSRWSFSLKPESASGEAVAQADGCEADRLNFPVQIFLIDTAANP